MDRSRWMDLIVSCAATTNGMGCARGRASVEVEMKPRAWIVRVDGSRGRDLVPCNSKERWERPPARTNLPSHEPPQLLVADNHLQFSTIAGARELNAQIWGEECRRERKGLEARNECYLETTYLARGAGGGK